MASARALLVSLLAVLVFHSAPMIHVAHGCTINIVNSCSFAVTTCAQSGSDPISQYQLGSGASQLLDFGSTCSWPAGAIWPSITGQCANPVGSGDATDRNLANLAEFTIGPGSGTDTYDLSNVNAYTLALGISVTSSAGGQCTTLTCIIGDISTFCQGDNVLETEPSGAQTCINTDGPGPVNTTNTDYFKTACPQAYSYSKDDATSTFTCGTGSDYQVTFCPSAGIGTNQRRNPSLWVTDI